MMPFVVMQIVEGPRVHKKWFGKSVADTSSLSDLFIEFSTGMLDNGSAIPDRLSGCKVVKISSNRSQDLIDVGPDTLVSEIINIGIYITFSVSDMSEYAVENVPANQNNAFLRLMSASRQKKLPVRFEGGSINNKQKLTNAIIDLLASNDLGFSAECVDSLGKELVSALTNTFWYIDNHFKTLKDRGHGVPEFFDSLQNFNKPENHKHRKRDAGNLNHIVLGDHSSVLFKICASSYMKGSKSSLNSWIPVRESLLRLADNLHKHAEYLKSQSVKMNVAHEKKVRRSDEYQWAIYHPSTINVTWQSKYSGLHKAILESPFYEPIFLNDFAPTDHRRKYDYIEHLSFPCKVATFSYTSARVHLHFVWKVDSADNEGDLLQKNDNISSNLKSTFPKYFTRAMRREFMTLYGKISDVKPAVLREIYRNLTGDHTALTNESEKQIHQRIAECLDGEDDVLLFDLRVNSGRVEEYLPFLEEVQKHIQGQVETAVSDRRHDAVDSGQVVTHMATALNASDLYKDVVKKCPDHVKIPSLQWLRWQFWPRHAGHASSKRYSGKIKIRYMIMARQFRASHPDVHYASAVWRYAREFSVRFRDHTKLLSQDDKHTVKVGEPGLPVAAVDRGKQVLVSKDQVLEVADHDFTKFSLTPSVTLKVDIPETIEGSFHLGQVFVGLKENAFQPSSGLRHLAEFSKIESSDKPIECHYHDGGPDHNLQHLRNKLANIAYFLQQNLDMLISVQTPPMHSWKNPAERCMSLLNIGLQSVGIMRQETENYEHVLKSANNLAAIRKLAKDEPAIEGEVINCIKPAINMLNSIFSRLTLGEKNLQSFEALSLNDLQMYIDILRRIDEDFDPSIILDSKQKLKDVTPKVMAFIAKHSIERQYMFSIKKCNDVDCVCGPVRLHQSIFEQLHHLPDPRPSTVDSDKYMPFKDAYGKSMNYAPDKHLPSPWVKNKEHGMPFSPSTQSAKNTTMVIQCEICAKWRCIYSKRKLDSTAKAVLMAGLDDLSYSCGASLNLIDSDNDEVSHMDKVYTSMKLSCSSPIEVSYFGTFPKKPLCFYCGEDDDFVNVEIKEEYPLCLICTSAGKVPQKRQTRAYKAKK